MIVRAKQPASNASAAFALAYSTNEVGNSNWQVFTPTAQWQEFSFTYNVPAMIAGGLDYLGIWGDTSNSGLEVLIDAVMIRCDTSNDVFEVNRYKAGVRDAGPVLWDFEGV